MECVNILNDTCCDAQRLSQSTGYFVILIVKALLCLLGITATVISLKVQGIRWLVHPNSKILFVFHTVWTLEVPLTFLGVYVFEIIRTNIHYENACGYALSAPVGVTLRGLPSLGVGLQSLTMCAMSIERAIATAIPDKYEKIKKPYLGFALGMTAAIFAPVEIINLVVVPIDWNEPLIASTLRTKNNSDAYKTHMYFHGSVEFFTISLFFISLAVNWWQYRNEGGKPLSWRYQVKENRRIIFSLLPGFCTHFILNMILIWTIQIYYKWHKDYDRINSLIVIELSSHVQMYSVIMPIIIAIRLRYKPRAVVDGHRDATSYFKHMNQYFDRKKP